MNKYIKFWENLKVEVQGEILTITPIKFYEKLLKWVDELKHSKNEHVEKLYYDYLEYYVLIDLEQYAFKDLWYSFDDLIKYDFFNQDQVTLDILVVRCRDILNEIITFKSDRECKLLGNDNLRVYANKYSGELFFCCDTCSYAENIKGEYVKVFFPILPATTHQIAKNKVNPCSF